MAALRRFVASFPLLLISPLLVGPPLLSLWLTDLLWRLFGRKIKGSAESRICRAASIVIPNWNGRDLLDKYLPSVIQATQHNSENEIIVVDNGSEDGSAEHIRKHFPTVRVLALPTNEGFGGGSNAGFRAARNDVVVLLNSDMRVDAEFLDPLLAGFSDPLVFAVSCQIFFSDPTRVREETGLTQGWWESGRLRVRHRIDDKITDAFPCFYGGGGSCAFDRAKFLELGGFDPLLRPFYLEDTDLGYMAWKRGWKVLYEPRSIVFHEHRGTIGRTFTSDYISDVLKKNFLLFCWKNIHEPGRLLSHFAFSWADAIVSLLFGDSPDRTNFRGMWKALLQLPRAVRSRWRARSLATIDDTEALLRPLGGYFRDRFGVLPPEPQRLSVLFVSPYPICPPIHGGGVFMYQTTMELAELCDLHLVVLLDYPHQRDPHHELAARCASLDFIVRMTGSPPVPASIVPHAITEFANQDLEWLIHRQIYLKQVDVLQLEYLPMGQYAGRFRSIACVLFEHDIYFQSIGRQLTHMRNPVRSVKARLEYLRALRYEIGLLPNVDRVQVCSRENAEYLKSFLPMLNGHLDHDLRAGIDTQRYDFTLAGREPETMLFLGSFRHTPNQEAIAWFMRDVLPRVLAARPDARLVVVGSDPPPRYTLPDHGRSVEFKGFVEDVLAPLKQYAVFVCPILSGSGVRVKLLEAFASGIPVVSTRIGAEGLATENGNICALADDAEGFASRIIQLFENPAFASDMATRARQQVESERDMRMITRNLERSYRSTIRAKRATGPLVSGRPRNDQPCDLRPDSASAG